MSTITPFKFRKILFLGDCNTQGTSAIVGNAYPEQFARISGAQVINCGRGMATIREGIELFKEQYLPSIDLICIQYGLVDSWLTFKYAPYVLYYPDSKKRKFARKLTKKFKKICKNIGLNRLIGTKNVVSLEEYTAHLRWIRAQTPKIPIVLIDTVPNKDTSRNAEIKRYNQALTDLAAQYTNTFKLAIYEDFLGAHINDYCDPTHLSITGHKHVANKLLQLLQSKMALHA